MVAECRYIIRIKTERRGENTLSQRLVLAQKLENVEITRNLTTRAVISQSQYQRDKQAAEKSRGWLMESEAELLQHGAVCCLIQQDQVINESIQENSLQRAALMVTFWNISSGNGRNKTKKSKNLGRVRENISLMGSLWQQGPGFKGPTIFQITSFSRSLQEEIPFDMLQA